jgi:N-acetylmuramoyl-L-alanine amidase
MLKWKRIFFTAVFAAVILSACGTAENAETASPITAAAVTTAAAPASTAAPSASAAVTTTAAATKKFTAHKATMYAKDTTGTGINVREYPSLKANVTAVLKNNDPVNVTGTSDDWTEVEISGKKCYIFSELLTDKAPAAETGAANAQTKNSGAGSQGGTGITETEVSLSDSMKYASFSKIHSGKAKLYKNSGGAHGSITVCVNAGHGTKGGESVKTQSHPDGSGKVTGGSNAAGAVTSMAVSSGMDFADGTPENKVTLKEAQILKQRLLDAGYSVLMIRESDDVQLDNIARTVLANHYADCHVAIHWDSTSSDKGAFFMGVPSGSYRKMEPVASTWEKSTAFGKSLINGLKSAGVKIFSSGFIEEDLTQTSYSTVPSIDIELGDRVSSHSEAALSKLADGLLSGIEQYFN